MLQHSSQSASISSSSAASSPPSCPGRKVGHRLRHFVGDGIWASVCEGVADNNFNAFATALLASPSQLSFFASSQSLLGGFLQLWSEKLVGIFGSRKRIVVTFVGLQSLTLSLMIGATLLGSGTFTFLSLALLYSAFGTTSGAIWSSWISDLLPAGRRGFCFGIRNQRTYPLSAVSLLVAGYILQTLESARTPVRITFCTVFTLGLIAKILSLRHLSLQPEIPAALPEEAFGPMQLMRYCLRDRPARQMLLFFFLLGFGINFSGPFQIPYLLNQLHFSYLQFSASTAVFVLARFLTAPVIGRIVDRHGSRKPLAISVALIPVVSVGWALSRDFPSILVTQFISGVSWTGYEVFAFTFLTESTPSAQRHRIFAARQVSWSLASFSGALAGGALGAVSATATLFWISTGVRAGAALVLFGLPHLDLLSESPAPVKQSWQALRERWRIRKQIGCPGFSPASRPGLPAEIPDQKVFARTHPL